MNKAYFIDTMERIKKYDKQINCFRGINTLTLVLYSPYIKLFMYTRDINIVLEKHYSNGSKYQEWCKKRKKVKYSISCKEIAKIYDDYFESHPNIFQWCAQLVVQASHGFSYKILTDSHTNLERMLTNINEFIAIPMLKNL